MLEIIFPVAAIGGMGVIFGALLAVASKVFAVKTDERIPKVTELLPGANCGGCGFSGCSACAEAMVLKGAPANCCPLCSDDTIKEISKILGVEAGKRKKNVAYVLCSGRSGAAEEKFTYSGQTDCYTALRLGGGQKACTYGCIGLGSCVKKCVADAIKIVDGVAFVNKEKCLGCGACVLECPKGIIKLLPYDAEFKVMCSSKDKGKDTMKACSAGCIGCGICAKNCPSGAIKIKDNVAVIDSDKCTKCGVCAEKCPRKIIRKYDDALLIK